MKATIMAEVPHKAVDKNTFVISTKQFVNNFDVKSCTAANGHKMKPTRLSDTARDERNLFDFVFILGFRKIINEIVFPVAAIMPHSTNNVPSTNLDNEDMSG